MSWSQHGSKGIAVDKSAYVRMQLGQAAELEEWGSERGLVRLSTVTRLELGFPRALLRPPGRRSPCHLYRLCRLNS